jgi:hypothetical protein
MHFCTYSTLQGDMYIFYRVVGDTNYLCPREPRLMLSFVHYWTTEGNLTRWLRQVAKRKHLPDMWRDTNSSNDGPNKLMFSEDAFLVFG